MWARKTRRPWCRCVELPARLFLVPVGRFFPSGFGISYQGLAFSHRRLGFHVTMVPKVWVICSTF